MRRQRIGKMGFRVLACFLSVWLAGGSMLGGTVPVHAQEDSISQASGGSAAIAAAGEGPSWNHIVRVYDEMLPGVTDNVRVTADGKYVSYILYQFDAATSEIHSKLVLYDCEAGTTEDLLLGVDDPKEPVRFEMSPDAEWFAFSGKARFGELTDSQVYLYNRQAHTMQLASKRLDGSPASGDHPSISADGRYVAYHSLTDDIVTEDAANSDVFVYDRDSGQSELVSKPHITGTPEDISWANSENPSISADGRYVAFESDSPYLAEGDDNGNADIFLFDRNDASMQLISVPASGGSNAMASGNASISADGTIVAFESYAALSANDTNNEKDIYVYRKASGTVERVSVAPDGGENEYESIEPLVSADGKFVTYETTPSSVEFDESMIADLTTRQTAKVNVNEAEEKVTLPLTNLALSSGAEVAAFNAGYTVTDPSTGEEFPMAGLFIASHAIQGAPTWPDGSTLESSDVLPDQVTLTWTPASDEKGIKEYRLYADGDLAATVDGSTLSYTVTNLVPAKDYQFRIEAVNADGVQSSGGPTRLLRTAADDQTLELTLRFDRLSGSRLPIPGSTLTIGAEAQTGRTIAAKITYLTWLDESGSRLPDPRTVTESVDMNETAAGSGDYFGLFSVKEGITRLTSITAVMTGAAGGSVEKEVPGLPLTVTGNLRAAFDNPGSVNLDNARLMITKPGSNVYKAVTVVGNEPILLEGLAAGDDYEVTLTSSIGKTLSKSSGVRIESGLTQNLVLPIAQTANYRFKVTDESGKPVPGIQIDLWDEAGSEYLAGYQSDSNGETGWAEVDDALKRFTAKVNLSDTNYETLPDEPVLLKPGENIIPITLQHAAEGQLKGKVLDPAGKPVFNALVTTTQMFKGKPVVQEAYTDLNGAYQLTVFAGEVAVQAAQSTYHYNSEDGLSATVTKGQTTTMNIPLKRAGNGMVVLNVYVKMIGSEWQGPIDMEQMLFRSDISANHGFRSSYYQNVIPFQGEPGEDVEACVTGILGSAVTECQTIRLDDKANGVAEIRMEEKGGLVAGSIAAAESGWTYANLYEVTDGSLRFVNSASFRTRSFELHAPKAGTYRLELHRRNPETDQEETAFKQVTIREQETMDVGTIALQASSYFTHVTANGFVAEPTEVSPGSTVNLRTFYMNSGNGAVNEAALKMELPEGVRPVIDSGGRIAVKVNGTEGMAVLEGNVVKIELGSLEKKASGTVTLQAKLDADYSLGRVQLSARIEGKAGDAQVNESLGYVQLEVPKVTLEAPDKAAAAEIAVVGLAPAGSRVRIYDENVLLGTSVASAGGTWQSMITLNNDEGSEYHLLRAQTDAGGKTLQSERKLVSYAQNQPILQEVALAQFPKGKWLRLDVENGIAQLPYTVVPGNPFAFVLKFSDPDKVKNVSIYMGGQIGGPVTAVKGTDGLFRATIPTTTGSLGGLYVDYDTIKPKVVVTRDIPSDEETRKKLPAQMKDFTIARKTPFHQDGNRYTGDAVIEFPQLPNMQLSVKETIDLAPANYMPSVEEIVEAETTTGIRMYNVSFDTKETNEGLAVKMSGYIPKAVLFPEGEPGADVHRLAALDDDGGEFDPLEVLDEMGIDATPYEQGMVQVTTDYTMIAKGAYDQVNEVKGQYEGYRDYAGKISKIMSGVEAATACPENIEATSDQAGKALLVTVGGEVAKTALGAWTGAMMLEGPVGFIGGYAAKYVSTKIDSYVDEEIDKVSTVGPTSMESCKDDPYRDDPEEENIYKKRLKRVARLKWVYDPSGYVYEAVPGNRLENVKATVLYKDPVNGGWKVWDDADAFGQVNPQLTDQDGRYGWDVPEGVWKVVWEKPGYETASSGELTVPPPHFDVNEGLESKASPAVNRIEAYAAGKDNSGSIDITFSKYLRTAADIPDDEITVKGPDGNAITGTLAYMERQKSASGDEEFARTIRFTPTSAALSEGTEYTVHIAPQTIISYAGAPLASVTEQTVKAVVRDTSGPTLKKAEAQSGNTVIELDFDQVLSTESALDPDQFEVTGTSGTVLSAAVVLPEGTEPPQSVVLTISRPFAEGASITVTAKQGAVTGLSGNLSEEQNIQLTAPNAALRSLTVEDGELSEPFSSGKTEYTLKVGASAHAVKLRATLAEAGGKLSIRGVPMDEAMMRTVEIPSDGIIPITVEAANHPEVTKVYTLVVERGTNPPPDSDPDPAPGPGSGTGSDSGTPPAGDKADIGRDAKVTETHVSEGRKGAIIELNAAAVKLAAQSAKTGEELYVKAPNGYDSYDVLLSADAFRSLSQAKVTVRLQTDAMSLRLQPEAWAAGVKETASGVHVLASRASIQDEQAWFGELKKRFPGLTHRTGLYRFSVEAAEGDRQVALPWPESNSLQAQWSYGNASDEPGGNTNLYRYNSATKEWRFAVSRPDAAGQRLTLTIVDSSYAAVMTYRSTFKDIAGHWAKDQIDWMAGRMLISGYTAASFQPDRKVTRAEFAAMLANIMGLKPAAGGVSAFADVKPGEWYYDAANAAAAAGLAAGDGSGNFLPSASITREQMTVLTWRAYRQYVAGAHPIPEGDAARILGPYGDGSKIKNWARLDVASAIEAGLARGVSATRFDPDGSATRAQAVTILRKIAEKLESQR